MDDKLWEQELSFIQGEAGKGITANTNQCSLWESTRSPRFKNREWQLLESRINELIRSWLLNPTSLCKMQRVSNFAPHKITIAPDKMKQRGEVARKLPDVLRLSEKEEAAPSSTQGWRKCRSIAQRAGDVPGVTAKRGAWEERWRTVPRGEDSSSLHRGPSG